MKIAILGAGNVGGTLAKAWARLGHTIILGVRVPAGEKARAVIQEAGGNVKATTLKDAASQAEVVLLATSWNGAQDALRAAGDLSGKILIDTTNAFKEGMTSLMVGGSTSGGEQVAAWAPGARVVKAFNHIGVGVMANTTFGSEKASLFICGDDAGAKQVVAGLASQLGFDVVDAGALWLARYIEPLAGLWVSMAYVKGMGPNIAFKMLKR